MQSPFGFIQKFLNASLKFQTQRLDIEFVLTVYSCHKFFNKPACQTSPEFIEGCQNKPPGQERQFMTPFEYKSYIDDIMEMSNNGNDLAKVHIEVVEKVKSGDFGHREHHALKDIYEALCSGWYQKEDFE